MSQYSAADVAQAFRETASRIDLFSNLLVDSDGYVAVTQVTGVGSLTPHPEKAAFVLRLPESDQGPPLETTRFRVTVERLEP